MNNPIRSDREEQTMTPKHRRPGPADSTPQSVVDFWAHSPKHRAAVASSTPLVDRLATAKEA